MSSISDNRYVDDKPLSFLEALSGTLVTGLGVLPSAARLPDFTKGMSIHFIALDLIFAIIFILSGTFVIRVALSKITSI